MPLNILYHHPPENTLCGGKNSSYVCNVLDIISYMSHLLFDAVDCWNHSYLELNFKLLDLNRDLQCVVAILDST